MPHNTGMDWIRLPKRMAIYHRDGFACIWCGHKTDELGYGLTLDHVHLKNRNECFDLVTSCKPCNSAKKKMLLIAWLERVAVRTGESPQNIAYRVLMSLNTPLDIREGKRLAAMRRPRKDSNDEDLRSIELA